MLTACEQDQNGSAVRYPLLSLKSSSSFLRLLPRLLVTSIAPNTSPSITLCGRQFIHKMWPIQLAFRLLISCRIFLCSLTLSNTPSFVTWLFQMFSILLQNHISKLSSCFWSTARSVQLSALHKATLLRQHFARFFLSSKPQRASKINPPLVEWGVCHSDPAFNFTNRDNPSAKILIFGFIELWRRGRWIVAKRR